MKKCLLFFVSSIFIWINIGYSQSGQFDVRFKLHSIDLVNNIMYVDIEVRATSPASLFNMSDQNYRFSFLRSGVAPINPPIDAPLTNPPDRSFFILDELCVSQFVQLNNLTSFYNPHTLTGSIDTVVSVNINLAGGDGYPVGEHNNNPLPATCNAPAGSDWPTGWVHVTRLRVQLIGPDACLDLVWHTHDPFDFPPTFIGEKFAGILYEVTEGVYENFSMCLVDPLPIELLDFKGFDLGCEIHLEWYTASEVNNDYFVILGSDDGKKFKEIDRVKGSGTTSTVSSYYYTVENISPVNYYKLVQVDYDGKTSEHKTIVVNSDCIHENLMNQISLIFPNPANQNENIRLKFFAKNYTPNGRMIITNIYGKQVDQVNTTLENGINTLSYNASLLEAGSYFISIQGERWISNSQKFIKLDY